MDKTISNLEEKFPREEKVIPMVLEASHGLSLGYTSSRVALDRVACRLDSDVTGAEVASGDAAVKKSPVFLQVTSHLSFCKKTQ